MAAVSGVKQGNLSLQQSAMKTIFLVLAVMVSALAVSRGQEGSTTGIAGPAPRQTEIKEKYHRVEVERFDLKQGVEFPPEFLKSLQEEISKQLVIAKVFESAFKPEERPTGSVVRLSGTIHNYKKGSQAKRYLVSFGAGAAEIDARVSFNDAETGQQLVVEEIRAVLVGGLLGGKEEGVTRLLARQVVTQARLMMERRLPASADGATTVPTENSASPTTPPDRHTLTVDAKNWEETEQKLNQEAAVGYRVVDFSLTGSSTAELELEKLAAPPELYQYRWIRVRMATHLQKDINRATADGFQASLHTLAWLGPFLTVLMEKPPIPSATQYQYLVAQPFRLSSAQKDIENHEREGYTLVDESDTAGLHTLLFEKATEKMEADVTKK